MTNAEYAESCQHYDSVPVYGEGGERIGTACKDCGRPMAAEGVCAGCKKYHRVLPFAVDEQSACSEACVRAIKDATKAKRAARRRAFKAAKLALPGVV